MALMIRLSKVSDETLSQLAKELGESKQSVLSEAIEAYRREVLLNQTNAAYAAMKARPADWAEELEERRLWDSTLSDGLGQKHEG